MGIQGLLKALKPFTNAVHVQKYAGQRVGIDAYSWLHKGAYGCSTELCRQSSLVPAEDPSKLLYVKYCMHRIFMLKYNGVIPVMVFDGGRLPLKAATENERQRQREKNLELAQESQARGDFAGANEYFQKAVEITPLMANELIRVLKDNGVEFVVAPYEADAQLAWLAKRPPEAGGVAAIISEDSDLLAYGCPVVIFKMDKYGQGEEISIQQVFESATVSGCKLSFGRFDAQMFLGMCVLAGCDFLPSIPGIGIMKAHAIVEKYEDLDWALSKIAKEKKVTLPERYILDFWQARAIFLHARVYDTVKRELQFLNPLPEDFEERCGADTDFLGPELPQSRARAIAQGFLDPITMCAFNMSQRRAGSFTALKPSGVRVKQEVASTTGSKGPFDFFGTCRAGHGASFTSQPVSSSQPPPSKNQGDHGFVAHLQHMGVNMAAGRSSVLQEHNGVKRVLPPLPDNNPFKRAKQHDLRWGGEQLLSRSDEKENVTEHNGKESSYCFSDHRQQRGTEGVATCGHSTQQSGFQPQSSGLDCLSEPQQSSDTRSTSSDITSWDVKGSGASDHDWNDPWPAAEEALISQHQELVLEEPDSQQSSTSRIVIGTGENAPRPVYRGKPRSRSKLLPNPQKPPTLSGGCGILRFFKPVTSR